MNSDKLQSRLKYINATSLQDRAKTSVFSRRGENYIEPDEEEEEAKKFETFFDYEEELSGLKPAAEQYTEMTEEESNDPYIILEDKDPKLFNDYNPIELEEAGDEAVTLEEISSNSITMEEALDKPSYMDVKGFEFIQCEHIKKDGLRCKRQAKKKETLCASHKKMLKIS
tara:strand:- start:387 stop:896 length:510 start_codon:yes stop_codon:yes gene_type:complete